MKYSSLIYINTCIYENDIATCLIKFDTKSQRALITFITKYGGPNILFVFDIQVQADSLIDIHVQWHEHENDLHKFWELQNLPSRNKMRS